MAYCGFLTATMVFAADPMEANIAPGEEGAGLSPLLQHPAMLIHPPIVFLGYAAWAVPCALAIAALLFRRLRVDDQAHSRALIRCFGLQTPLDSTWVRIARPWALVAWTVLGGGILLGAYWSYEELGWGGYWAWDPVENGSLIPWLIGTAFIHTLMAWQYSRHAEKNQHRAGDRLVRDVQLRHVSDPQRHLQQSARLQPVADRLAVSGIDAGAWRWRSGVDRATSANALWRTIR